MTEAHWYLWALGVEPSCQGKGIGGSIIQPVLARSDLEGALCYLETHSKKNVPFFKRHGFEVVNEGFVPESVLRVWAWLRNP